MEADDWESDGEFEASILDMEVNSKQSMIPSSGSTSAVSVQPKIKREPRPSSCSTPTVSDLRNKQFGPQSEGKCFL